MYGSPEKNNEPDVFKSDFPTEEFGKNDYKKALVNMTFGNDKVITNKGFRPSYGIS